MPDQAWADQHASEPAIITYGTGYSLNMYATTIREAFALLGSARFAYYSTKDGAAHFIEVASH
jgi:hypothetical protein